MNIEYDVFLERGFNVEYVDEIDLVSMLSNILSNAFQAAIMCKNRYVKVQTFMQNVGCFSVIKVINTYDGNLILEDNKLKSTKSDDSIHGIGIKSIKEIASKYNGYYIR